MVPLLVFAFGWRAPPFCSNAVTLTTTTTTTTTTKAFQT